MALDYIQFKRDVYLAPFTITSDTNTIVFDYDGDQKTLTLDHNQTFYMTRNGLGIVQNANALLKVIEDWVKLEIDAAASITIQDGPMGMERLRITIPEFNDWSFHQSSTFNIVWLGYDTGMQTSALGRTDALASMKYHYVTESDFEGQAFSKISRLVADVRYSSEKIWQSFAARWGTEKIRTITYSYLPSARVILGRANDATRAIAARCVWRDPHVTFSDIFYALQSGYQAWPVIICHDYENIQGCNFIDRWEAITMYQPTLDYLDIVADMGLAGDYWDLTLELVVIEGNYQF